MGFSDFTNSLGFGSINLGGLFDTILKYAAIVILLVIIGAIVMAIAIRRKNKKSKNEDTFKVGWWVEQGNEMTPSRVDDVEEIVIPGTILRIFHNKKKDLWIPRFTRGVSPKLFYVCLTPTNQMINFSIPSISKELAEANLTYDHTDMLWAAENSREYIKRNYKNKAIKWWQLYQNTIATAALLIVITFCFIMIIYFMRGLAKDLSGVVSTAGELLKQATAAAQTSGVVTAG